jgi:branched-chain amino acid aminotransferase
MQIEICDIPVEKQRDPREVLSKPLGFGRVFCDRMFTMSFHDGQWRDPKIEAYRTLELDPAALVLHYAQEIFEGLKAYQRADGRIGLFRPEKNAERMNTSARRLVMPEIPVEDQVRIYKTLVSQLKDWVPTQAGYSLYLRPTMIATTPVLGVQAAHDYLYYIICSPVAGYFARGFAPVRITTCREYVRSAVGGLGAAKTGGNYAASLLAAQSAKKEGYDQVVWLDAKEHRYIEEMGGMNIFFVKNGEIYTSPLTGSILPGITRDSILTLAPELGLPIHEDMIDAYEVCKDIKRGAVSEIFACGTAAVVTAIGSFGHAGTDYQVGDGQPGPITRRLYEHLVNLQTGRVEDRHGWCQIVEV